ncbi:unnamed protein product [Moneuplotes crassus]|uniref:Uncharacterized protein n=1 Tax=Euplotes crassus TaxID=5936 RepID=A0AAD2D9A2_EUPCR|nr:unnamed protein product [Moneuplotes crassus]
MVSHAWTIPKAHKKKRKRKRWASPGPGEYEDVDLNLVKVAPPEWTIKGKYPWKVECLDGPGPGTYSVSSERPGTAYTIQGKRKEYYITDEPGPGSYSLNQTYDNVGGYMGKKLKKKKEKEKSPGPAEYFPPIFKSHDGWTFGMKPYEKYERDDSPGPGAYEIYKRSVIALGKFGKEKRGKLSTSYDSPGPGHYSPKLSTRDGWTIQGRSKPKYEIEDGPGPGDYFPFYDDGGPAYSMAGKRRKKDKIYDEPGPHTYFPSILPTKPRPRSARFTSGRRDLTDYDQPGPGQYSIPSLSGGPYTTLKGRPRTAERRNDYPGPGEYRDRYKLTKPRAASASIGRARRMGPPINDTPGPGFYNYRDKRDYRGTVFGSSTRPCTAKTGDGPGPGSYNIRSTFGDKPGKTMAGKRRYKSVGDDTPGPGMYNPKLDGGIAYTCQGKNIMDYNLRESFNKPGPGQYFPSYDPVRPHYPGKTMGGKRKAKYDDEIPGPGAYNQYMWDNKGNGWTMGMRPHTAGQDQTPGPAAYFPHLRRDAPAYTMGGNRNDPFGDEYPGPGDYDLRADWNRGILMGKDKRLEIPGGLRNQFPGPGTYYLPEYKGKGVYMGEKFYNKDFFITPGPGSYEHNQEKEGPHYSIAGMGLKGKYETVGPGPAAYDIVKSFKEVFNSKPGKSFGKKTGYKSKGSEGPGPGTYYLPKSKGQGITMKGRYPDHINDKSPGPAAYNQKWLTIQNLIEAQKAGSGGTMSKSRDFYHFDKSPGPGTYDSPSKLTNIGVKFGKEIRGSEKKSENPGPGYYYIPCTVADVPKYVYPNPDPRYKWV